MTLNALGRNERGATIVEFALILPVMCMLLLGTLDLGYRSYVTSIIQGSLHEAARMATVGGVPTSAIEAHVRDRLRDFSGTATITTETRELCRFQRRRDARDDHPGYRADGSSTIRATASRTSTATTATTSTAAAAASAARRTSSISR